MTGLTVWSCGGGERNESSTRWGANRPAETPGLFPNIDMRPSQNLCVCRTRGPTAFFREQAEMCTTQRTGVRKNGPGRPACFRRRRAGARMPRWGRSRQRGHSGAHPLAAVVAYHTNWGNVIRHSRDLSSSPIPPDKSDSFRQLQKHKYKSSRFYTRGEKYR